MKHIKLISIILAMLLVFGGACGKSEAPAAEDPGTKAPAESPAATDNSSAEPAEPQLPAEEEKDFNTLLSERLSLYADFLPEYCVPLLDSERPNPHFDLLFLDGDELPELAIIEDNYHPIGAHIFMVVDGKITEAGEFGTYGTCWYSPKQSLLDNTDMAMGEMLRQIVSVDEKGKATVVKSLSMVEGEEGDIEKYLIDEKEVESEAFWAESEKWDSKGDNPDNAVIYDGSLNYSDYKEDLYGALKYRFENPFDFYTYDFNSESYIPSIDELVGKWVLYRYETEGDDGYAGENGIDISLIIYGDGKIDYIEDSYEEDIELYGLPLDVDQDGYLTFTYESHDTDINNTFVGLNEDELEMSLWYNNPDGTYGGSEWFFVRAN